MQKILITGASGFVGSFLVEAALKRDLEVYAGVRKTSSRAYLQDDRIKFFEVNFSDVEGMAKRLAEKRFDYIIHNAGIVGALKKEDYFSVNFEFTKKFVEAIKMANLDLKKFTYTSSIAAYGPASDKDLEEYLKEEMPPNPITTYGKSKLESENYLKSLTNFPWLIFRPTAVYGPREKDIFSFFQIINRNLETYIGSEKQHLTFIYVKDLARLFIDATLSSHQQKAYFAANDTHYSSQDLGRFSKKILNKKTLKIHVPIGLARFVGGVIETLGKLVGQNPTFNLEKVAELSAKNWKCDVEPLKRDFNFQSEYDLEAGLKETLDWYKKEGWL